MIRTRSRFWIPPAQFVAAGGGTTFIRWSSNTDMAETGDGSTGWIYTATASDGRVGTPDWTIADGTSGTWKAQINDGTGTFPIIGLYLVANPAAFNSDCWLRTYPFSGSYVVETGPATGLSENAVTYSDDDWVRFTVTDEDYAIDIARVGSPTTWISLATGNIARAATLHPGFHSFSASGCIISNAQVV